MSACAATKAARSDHWAKAETFGHVCVQAPSHAQQHRCRCGVRWARSPLELREGRGVPVSPQTASPLTEIGQKLVEMLDSRYGAWEVRTFDAKLVRRIAEEFVPRVEGAARADERARLRAAVEAIPDHQIGGRDWEWNCDYRIDKRFPNCDQGNPEHDHELISRDRVLALFGDPV